ncbi:MAG: hypothetical protein R3E13_07150 [Alphaproteobacteria bacterium]
MSSAEPVKREDTLGDLAGAVWAGRVFVLFGLMIGALGAFVFVEAAVPHYGARMVLVPASPMNMAAVSEVGRSGAVSSVNAQNDMSFTRFEASYKGVSVAGLLLRDPEITAGLAQDKAFVFSDVERGWSAEKLAEYIARRVEIDPVGETRLRGFRYLHPDKDFAVMFLRRLHNITDGLIRHGLRKDVNERIAYLNEALSETMNPEHRRAMTDLLMEQERLKMLVSIDQPYAASVVVPAASSVKVIWPDPALVYSALMAVGAFLGFVVFSIRKGRAQDVLAGFPVQKIRQEPWFFPESGNSNERPEEVRRPLTGKKKPGKLGKRKKDIPPEAAE